MGGGKAEALATVRRASGAADGKGAENEVGPQQVGEEIGVEPIGFDLGGSGGMVERRYGGCC
jgi:hypothetical protein